MKATNKILSNRFYRLRYYGIALLLIAFTLTILYNFIDLSINIKLFAINSSFFESNWFTIIQTNAIEEIMMVLYILGLNLIIWSIYKLTPKEKYYLLIRSAIRSFWLVLAMQILAIIFFFGFGFVIYLIYNLVTYQVFFILFYLAFKIRDYRELKTKR